MKDVHVALKRAHKKKCSICAASGASLACSFRGAACCRPMHFRCALTEGARLLNGYKVFCSKHSKHSKTSKEPPPTPDMYLDRTPVGEEYITPEFGCPFCTFDSYDVDRGALLTCSVCRMRSHSKCVLHAVEKDGPFAALSWNSAFFCKSCMLCPTCAKPVDSTVYSSDLANENEQCDSLKCHVCRHFATHISCIPPTANPERWRCDACRICRHCNLANIPIDKWNEHYEACPECAMEIRNAGVVCPVCNRVYREYENLPMIQCDYCDKWIHADTCGGMSMARFERIGKSKERYRCPICTSEKKKSGLSKRRPSASSDLLDLPTTMKERNNRFDLEAFLAQMSAQSEDGVVFNVVTKASHHAAEMATIGEQMGLGSDVCRQCGSRGDEHSLLYCTDCGECYHTYCRGALSQSPFLGKGKPLMNALLLKHDGGLRAGKLGVYAAAWRCVRCESFANLPVQSPDVDVPPKKMNGTVAKPQQPISTFEQPHVEELTSTDPDRPFVRKRKNGALSQPRALAMTRGDLPPIYEPVQWVDKRKCCLCSRAEAPTGREGRLLPWASSTVSDSSSIWVHASCAMLSKGVTLHRVLATQKVSLFGLRKNIVGQARRTSCAFCAESGASLRCSAPGCVAAYHFHCAKDVGVPCVLRSVPVHGKAPSGGRGTGKACKEEKIPTSVLQRFLVFCPKHVTEMKKAGDDHMAIKDVHLTFSMDTVIKVLDRQGFVPDGVPLRKKPLSADRMLSLRIGSLTVLRFGQLVPEVNDFIVKKSLVPLGYCAARMFWSILNPGYRCLYFFEVCGHAQSGPCFVIRCSDAPEWRIDSDCPDKAWSKVVKMVKSAREKAGMREQSHQGVRTSGLEAFGLLNCIPVVTHIESLPLASMFNGRYLHKRVVTHKNKEIIFYNSLSKRYSPIKTAMCRTGCSRTDGFLPNRCVSGIKQSGRNRIPTYWNMQTGAAFQLEVAREAIARKEQPHVESDQQAKMGYRNRTGKRNAKTRSTPHLPVATEHQGIAESSKQRTVVLRSDIDGWGVFATKDIPAGQMIIEYVGEIIRPSVSDLRESKYVDKGIGCYMFEIVPGEIVDATMCGNAARYINHSCAPNCYSKTIKIDQGRHVVVIIAKRRIQRGEELSYDYKFPLDDSDKVKCGCGTEQCKGFMN